MKPISREDLKIHKRKCSECGEFSVEVNHSTVLDRILCVSCLIFLLRQNLSKK